MSVNINNIPAPITPGEKAPYLPQTYPLGGFPTVEADVPVCMVFLLLFTLSAAGHMTVLQLNRRNGHKWILSNCCFGYSLARITTMTLRIVWAAKPTDMNVAITATIFNTLGVVILFILALFWTQRIVRAAHPDFGWHSAVSFFFLKIQIFFILVSLFILIATTVDTFYTLNPTAHQKDRNLQRGALTYLTFVAFLPIPMVLLAVIIPGSGKIDKFGTGRWKTKVFIVLLTSTLLCMGAGFRCGTAWRSPRPLDDPAWFDAKWAYYLFNFTFEVVVIFSFLLLRFDHRFYIPNGAHGPGSYSNNAAIQAALAERAERLNKREQQLNHREQHMGQPTAAAGMGMSMAMGMGMGAATVVSSDEESLYPADEKLVRPYTRETMGTMTTLRPEDDFYDDVELKDFPEKDLDIDGGDIHSTHRQGYCMHCVNLQKQMSGNSKY